MKPSILVPFPFTFRVAYKALEQSCEEGGTARTHLGS